MRRSKDPFRSRLRTTIETRFSKGRFKGRFSRKKALKPPSFSAMIPNITTIMALCTGLSSIRFAIHSHWEWAVACILIAAILDALDGRLARLLGSTSRFGAELDSFSDFISFGVCPSLLLYLWSLHAWGGGGWIIALLFSVCMALRLARFNVWSIEGKTPVWSYGFFFGVPAPAAAILGLSPLIFFLWSSWSFFSSPFFSALSLILVAFLMVSRLPTYSLKKASIPVKWVVPLLLGVGLFGASLFTHFWATVSGIVVAYVASFPFSFRAAQRRKEEQKSTETL